MTETLNYGALQKIDAYLRRLRTLLHGINPEAIDDIVQELHSHIIDKANTAAGLSAGSVEKAMAELGTPEELASEYMTDQLLARAQVSRSPFRIIAGLVRWASLSMTGFFILLGTLVGYLVGVSFLLCGFLKPFHPRSAGLWMVPGSLGDFEISVRLGFGAPPAGARELLGWWMVPIGLVGGGALVMLTTSAALWCVRQYRASRRLRQL